jgi:hypothetical protein
MEEKLYQEYAGHVLRDAKEKGVQNVFPLEQAQKAKSIDLLPAGGFRV